MRRDMELVRSILRDVAESEGDIDARALTDDAHPFVLEQCRSDW